MENSAKALVIAGGVLLAIMVLTIGVYLVGELGKTADSYTTTLDAAELQKYNSNFEVFIGRNDIAPQEIVTLISLAQQKEQEVTIFIEDKDSGIDYTNCMNWEEADKSAFLQKKIEEAKSNNGNMTLYSYVADSIGYDNDGKVTKISFKKSEPL